MTIQNDAVGDKTSSMTARSLLGDPHPLNGWIKTVTLGQDHAGLNTTLLETADSPSKLLLIWRSAGGHWPWEGSELRMAVSEDMGASFQQERSIYVDPEWDTRNFATCRMAQGRLGILCTRFRLRPKVGIEVHAPLFIFSDDNGLTWEHRDLPLPPREGTHVNFHGNILDWPAAVGGAESGGFAAFSYSTPHKVIDGLYTRDNGDTWEWRIDRCHSSEFAPHLNEMWAERLGDRMQWMMVSRPVTADSSANAAVLFSDDLVTWDGPYDSGLVLSANAPCLVTDAETDMAYLYTVSRQDRNRELPADGQIARGNRMVVAQAPMAPLIRTKGRFADFGTWREVTTLPEAAIGYIFPRKVEGRWMAAVNCGETPPVATRDNKRTFLALITPQAPVIVDAPSWRSAMPQMSVIDNGTMTLWQRGTDFELEGPAVTADRWQVRIPVGDRATAARTAMHHPKNINQFGLSCAAQAPSGTGAHRIVQRIADVATGAGERVTLTMRAQAFEAGPKRLATILLRQDFGAGGPDPVTVKLAEDVTLTNQPLAYSYVGALPSVLGKAQGHGAALELILEIRRTDETEPYHHVYGDIGLIIWPVPAPVLRGDAHQEALRCAKYYQRHDVLLSPQDPAGFLTADVTFSEMAQDPVLTLLQEPAAPAQLEVSALTRNHARLALRTGPTTRAESVTLMLDAESLYPAPKEGETARPDCPDATAFRIVSGTGPAWLTADVCTARNWTKDATPLAARSQTEDRLRLARIERQLLDSLLAGEAPSEALVTERKTVLEAITKN
ncbi:sialidase family protein [uncultured Sulfitobacter sp.]|uniref:sialidase family protein n=1 Tax=uncultured Sulfitobacter sp. TaxID=191468 RepID=UPI00260E914E|nr:sialidase family protein [uncultured Sulfitobacter sp.]